MTDTVDSGSNQSQAETRTEIERYTHLAGSVAVCVAALAFAYFGVIYWLAGK